MKTAARLIFVAVGLIALALVFNTTTARWRHRHPWDDPPEIETRWKLDRERLQERGKRLAASLMIPTISTESGPADGDTFLKLHQHLKKSTENLFISTSTIIGVYMKS